MTNQSIEEFPICLGDDTAKGDHSRNGGNYQHSKDSKKIFKYPTETVSVIDLKARWGSKTKGERDFCVPVASEIESIMWGGKEYKSFSILSRDLGIQTKNSKDADGGQTRCFKEFIESVEGDDEKGEIKFTYKHGAYGKSATALSNAGAESGALKTKKGIFMDDMLSGLNLYKNMIVEGVAGSGKSHMLQELRAGGVYGSNGSRIEVVVFHPSTSYEEFVSGIRPNFMNKEGEGGFVSQEGVFVEMCNRAAANPDKNFLLFIDEINRANTARVFGDLMLVLEKSKRKEFTVSDREGARERTVDEVEPTYVKDENRFGALYSSAVKAPGGDYVRLQTSIYKTVEGEDEPIEFNKLVVPVNLHVLGTMNTTDRSVGTIDLALRRRFHWVTREPMSDKDKLLDALNLSGDKSVGTVADWFMDANSVLKTEVGPDARLGHAYFFGKKGDAKAIADALITQLLEIIFTFNIKKDVLEKIGLPKLDVYNGKELGFDGQGLGRRPVVKEPEAEDSQGNQ